MYGGLRQKKGTGKSGFSHSSVEINVKGQYHILRSSFSRRHQEVEATTNTLYTFTSFSGGLNSNNFKPLPKYCVIKN